MIIAVDMDEILANFFDQLLLYHNDKYNTSYKREDIVSYDLWDVWGGTKEEAIIKIRQFFHSKYFDEIRPIEGSLKGIAELKKRHTLVVITSRFDIFMEKTILWLKKHYKDSFKDVYFTHYDKDVSKASVCKKLGVDIIIDDAEKNAIECSREGIKVLLYDYPWNRKLSSSKNIKRVHSWKDILLSISSLET